MQGAYPCIHLTVQSLNVFVANIEDSKPNRSPRILSLNSGRGVVEIAFLI